jgi:hypothetical protein
MKCYCGHCQALFNVQSLCEAAGSVTVRHEQPSVTHKGTLTVSVFFMFTVEPYSGRPLYTLGSSKSYELMYNLGVSLLHAGRPVQAFDCLIEAVQVYHMNPRLWLRLAECCVMAHKAVSDASSYF